MSLNQVLELSLRLWLGYRVQLWWQPGTPWQLIPIATSSHTTQPYLYRRSC